jgi:uncharacterized protein (DUF2141 family)
MSNTFLAALLITFFQIPSMFSQPGSKTTLEIHFSGLRTSEGKIAIGVNTREEGWPREPQMSYDWEKEVHDGMMKVRIPDLPYGTYAISVLDDVNRNVEMDMFLGIPKEGWGFSMNPGFKLSAPRFEECAFKLDKPYQLIVIEMRYAGKGK